MEYCKLYGRDKNILVHIMGLYEDRDGGDHVSIRIEKENDVEVYAKFDLPANFCTHAYGFSETELMKFKKFLQNNAMTIWDMARGNLRAESVG
ncbi:MAG: hypothetical protein IJ812_00020 [Schwartzia sp.]|nr:hypothetical protein [Schwartzia sp. (in: firmicutes)]